MEAVSGTGWTSYASASILAIAQEMPGGFNVGATHRNGRRYAFRSRRAITSGSSANRNVWSAAVSQAKNETDRLVCANVYGLCWSTKLRAMMECGCALFLFSNAVLEDFSCLQV